MYITIFMKIEIKLDFFEINSSCKFSIHFFITPELLFKYF